MSIENTKAGANLAGAPAFANHISGGLIGQYNNQILPQSAALTTEKAAHSCIFPPNSQAVAVVGAVELVTKNSALRPVCAACLNQVRNALAALADSHGRVTT